MAKKTRPATLAQQLQAVRGELADAEAECVKLYATNKQIDSQFEDAMARLNDQKSATEAIQKTWAADVNRLTAERDDFAAKAERLAKENGVFNEIYTHECSQRKAAQEVLQSWQVAAVVLGVTSLALAIWHAF